MCDIISKRYMKKLRFLVIFGIFVSLLLTGCMNPVDFDRFLKDEKVQDTIGGGNKEPEKINLPELGEDNAGQKRPLGKDDEVIVSISGRGGTIPTSVIVKVTNDFIYDSFEWYWKGTKLPNSGKEQIVDTLNAHFNKVDRDFLSVIGWIGSKPYSTIIGINVVD